MFVGIIKIVEQSTGSITNVREEDNDFSNFDTAHAACQRGDEFDIGNIRPLA